MRAIPKRNNGKSPTAYYIAELEMWAEDAKKEIEEFKNKLRIARMLRNKNN